MSNCNVCKNEVDWEEVTETFDHLFQQVDLYGAHSLTEYEQTVYEGHICSSDCFEDLKDN